MEINEMSMDDVQTRMAEIETELETDGADLEALSAEVDNLNERAAAIEARANSEKELRAKVAGMKTKPVEIIEEKENRTMEMEIRNTKEYINAYARYIQTNDDKECRALLTQNASGGTVAVPEFVYDEIKTAWEEEGIMSRVRKAYLKGNVKVGFEISATGATKHTEGQSVNEQTLVMGIVELTPDAIKKWISISDEALDLDDGEAYLRHIYRELSYHIAKKAADELVAKIVACGTQSTTTQVAVPVYTSTTVSVDLVAQAIALLSDEASKPTVMMNKLTYAALKAAQYNSKFPVDVLEGCDVAFNNTIKAFSAATTGDTYMIVGDLGAGALANFPNGEGITVKRDDFTLATSDLVRFIGREYVAVAPVAPNAFVKVVK